MKNTSNNPIFCEIRELEAKCIRAGKIKIADIKTSNEMRDSAWRIYLANYKAHLEALLGGAQ